MTIVPDLSRVPYSVEWSIVRSADLQATRRRLQRTLGRWGVDEWRNHSGSGDPAAVALERQAFAGRTWAWRAAARARMLRPAAVRRAVLVRHGAAR